MRNPSYHEHNGLPVQPAVVSSFWDGIKRKLSPLDFDDLLTSAVHQTGFDDLGDFPCEEALHVIIDACNTEACLSLFGQFAARQHLLDLLKTRLRLVNHWRRMPEIQGQAIHRPLFITGMPRSGSTFLHDLFAQDPGNRVPLTWEVMFPLPNPSRESFGSDPRIARAENRLRWLRWIKPEIVKAHPLGARLPQECIAIMSYSFLSDEFLCMFCIPSYEAWLRNQDMGMAYRFHRRFLNHLQWLCPGERWVLKAPDHAHAISALFDTYPDARIVFLHRDPLKVLGSVSSLAALLKGAFRCRINPRRTGIDEARILAEKVQNIMEFHDRHHPSLSDHFIDIHFLDLVREPVATVRHIYDRFGLALSADAEMRMQAYLNAGRNKRRPQHIYRLSDFGLDPEREASRFAAYRERFAVERESL